MYIEKRSRNDRVRLLLACQPQLQIGRKVIRLRSFTRGILIGIGIGFLFAPMKGEELRRILAESSRARLDEYTHKISGQVAYARENWRDYARQAASKMKETGAILGAKARQAGQDLTVKMQSSKELAENVVEKARQTSQELAYKAKQTVGLRNYGEASTRVIPERNLNY